MRPQDSYVKDLKSLGRTLNFTPQRQKLYYHLIIDLTLMGMVTALLIFPDQITWFICQILIPILIFRCFALMHECVHGSASRNEILNHTVGLFSGAFCFLPYFAWRKIHLQHHYWAGNIERDPTMRIIKDYRRHPRRKMLFLNFAWQSWIPLLALMQHVVFWSSGFRALTQSRGLKEKTYMFLSYLIPAILYFLVGHIFLEIWPALIIYLVMVEVVNFPHHLELPQHEGDHRIPALEQFQVSRTCHYSKFISEFVLNNFNYHSEHHLYPTLPWYRLRGASNEIKKILNKNYNESKSNTWIIRNRRKKIQKVLIQGEMLPSPAEKIAS